MIRFRIVTKASLKKTYGSSIFLLFISVCSSFAQVNEKDYLESNLNFIHRGDSLFGKLIVPKRNLKATLPVIIFVHGSGAEDYSSSGNYEFLWQEFTSIGFAVFSWDKQGVNKSQGRWYEQGISQRASEVIAGINTLKKSNLIDSTKIGLWGISQAGWVMPQVVNKTSIAFVISVSSPVTTAFDQELYRVKSMMSSDGFSAAEIKEGLSYTKRIKQLIKEGKDYNQFAELQNEISSKKWADYVIQGNEIVYTYVKVILKEDRVPQIDNYKCPLLALWGANDLLVPPVKSSTYFENRMKKIKNSNSVIKVIENADHTLTYNITGRVSETQKRRKDYRNNAKEIFAPGAVETMVNWLKLLYP